MAGAVPTSRDVREIGILSPEFSVLSPEFSVPGIPCLRNSLSPEFPERLLERLRSEMRWIGAGRLKVYRADGVRRG